MSDIFISYASHDRKRVLPIVEALERTGWSVFWDNRIPPGKTWRQFIGSEIESARCVVVIWTLTSIESHWVQEEADIGSRKGILIPVSLDKVEPPFGFRTIQSAYFLGWDGDPSSSLFRQLLEAVSSILGTSPADQVKQAARRKAEPQAKHEATKYAEKPKADIRSTDSVFQDTLEDGSKGPAMVFIAGGKFQMGSDPKMDSETDKDEQPRHEVTIKAFYIGKHEVTFAEYDAFAKISKREPPDDKGWGRGQRPVINVDWQDAVAYADWLSNQTGKRYRLPNEAEWEYVARAATNTKYWWGDDIQQNGQVWANCDGCGNEWSGKQTSPVGSFKPNAFGIHDTAGNVWEWVQDCWHDDYQGAPTDGSAWLEVDKGDCTRRVIRGGSWYIGPRRLRSAFRNRYNADERGSLLGFRLAQDVE